MKTTKTRKYLSLFMAICMLMSCLMQISAFATSIQESEMIPEGGEEELMPMAACGCGPQIKYDSNGEVYSVTFFNVLGQVEARIDYQGKPHYIDGAYRLPHQHNYTYYYGPNGEGPSVHDDPTYTDFRQWE